MLHKLNFLANKVSVAAHRGLWNENLPENSIAAIENAIAKGCDIVEIDVRRTLDGQFIIIHDEYLSRTTTGFGKVSEYTMNELKNFPLLNPSTGESSQLHIPTLQQVLKVTKGRIIICLDKCYEYLFEIAPMINQTGTAEQVILKGNHPPNKLMQDYGHLLRNKHIAFMPIINSADDNAAEWIFQFENFFNPMAIEFFITEFRPNLAKLVQLVLKKGIKAWANPVSKRVCQGFYEQQSSFPERHWDDIIKLGFNILNTDFSGKMLNYLRSNNLHG